MYEHKLNEKQDI